MNQEELAVMAKYGFGNMEEVLDHLDDYSVILPMVRTYRTDDGVVHLPIVDEPGEFRVLCDEEVEVPPRQVRSFAASAYLADHGEDENCKMCRGIAAAKIRNDELYHVP